MAVLVPRPGVRKTRKNALCMRYSVFFLRICTFQHKYAGKKWENFETRKRARRTFVHNLCAFCGRVHGFAECKGVGVVLRRVAARRILRLPLTTRGEWV